MDKKAKIQSKKLFLFAIRSCFVFTLQIIFIYNCNRQDSLFLCKMFYSLQLKIEDYNLKEQETAELYLKDGDSIYVIDLFLIINSE